MMKNTSFYTLITALFLLIGIPDAEAQRRRKQVDTSPDAKMYSSLEYRLVGPFRGGRSAAVTGVPGKPNLFYFGATGGGVWKTLDGGRS